MRQAMLSKPPHNNSSSYLQQAKRSLLPGSGMIEHTWKHAWKSMGDRAAVGVSLVKRAVSCSWSKRDRGWH
eukprot:221659-Pleurochrysis_carterae.AAC.3